MGGLPPDRIENQVKDAEILTSLGGMFTPNEEEFWQVLNQVEISVASSRLDSEQHGEEIVKVSMRKHLASSKRLFDILYFDSTDETRKPQSIPLFEAIAARQHSKKEQNGDGGDGTSGQDPEAMTRKKPVGYSLAKISDSQEQCIVSLNPTLLYPSETEETWSQVKLASNEATGKPPYSIRQRKTLGNYKNTGFCHHYVFGTEFGSENAWLESGYKTVRGFNLKRKQGESRIRHMLCIEMKKGKVFLKWCTQCHLWKNLKEFCSDNPEQPLETFCSVCLDRQKESRKKQLKKRRDQNKNKMPNSGGANGQPKEILAPYAPGEVNGNGADKVNVAVVSQNAVSTTAAADVDQSIIVEPPNPIVSTIDAPQTPEIQEAQKGQGNSGEPVVGQNGTGVPPPPTEIQEIQVVDAQVDGATDNLVWSAGQVIQPNTKDARQHRSEVLKKKRGSGDATALAITTDTDKDNTIDRAMTLVERDGQMTNKSVVTEASVPGAIMEAKKKKPKRKLTEDEKKHIDEYQMKLLKDNPLVDYPFWHRNESDFLEALDSVKVDKRTLREYLRSPDRQGDILFFTIDKIPRFAEENNPIPKRGNLLKLVNGSQDGSTYCTNMRVSDEQKLCINSLKPVMIYPDANNMWVSVESKTTVCSNVRSTTQCKKKLENYKFTGFCYGCVRGEGIASFETWHAMNQASIRGFNLNRKKVDHRLRHMLCLEDAEKNKVFLKWCTQCHTWKNFTSFLKRSNGTSGQIEKLNTFCAVCHRRQVVSRKIQSYCRNPQKKNKSIGYVESFLNKDVAGTNSATAPVSVGGNP